MAKTDTTALRVKASNIAKRRLVEKHRAEFDKFYREECAKVGLSTRGDANAKKIAALEKELAKLKAKAETQP